MTEEENPYAPPISSNDDCTFDGDITTQSLRYLNRASKFAMFAIIAGHMIHQTDIFIMMI